MRHPRRADTTGLLGFAAYSIVKKDSPTFLTLSLIRMIS